MIEIWILYAQISRGKSVFQKFQKFEDFLGVSPLMSKKLYLSLTIYLKLENLHSSAKNVQSNCLIYTNFKKQQQQQQQKRQIQQQQRIKTNK